MTKEFKILVWKICALSLLSTACTSIGHENRATPKIEKKTEKFIEIGFDGDDNELSTSVENFLESSGVKVKIISTPQVREKRGDKEYSYDEIQTRYLIQVRSTDLDTCLPNGSRQMHFKILVTDYQERSRVFLMSGEFGCKDVIIDRFDKWLSKQNQ